MLVFRRCCRCGKLYRSSRVEYVRLYGREVGRSGYWCCNCMLQYISESLYYIRRRLNE